MSTTTEAAPDWRRLFDAARIPWSDRGKNVGRNRIVIHCPWCGASDPSMHLSVNTVQPVYYCLRNTQHKGGHRPGLIKLLLQLGLDKRQAETLLSEYRMTGVIAPQQYGLAQTEVMKQWASFRPAIESQHCLSYLYYERGFPDPEVVCVRYDLRYSPVGQWAARLLIPFKHNDTVLSWTGRAIRPDLLPKYKMQEVTEQQGLIYVGRPARSCGIIVEGPMDALKINAACEHLPVSAAALNGLALPDWSATAPHRLIRVRNFLQSAETRCIAVDATVNITQVSGLQKSLAEWPINYIMRRLKIPAPFKDPGAMDYQSVRDWITAYLSVSTKGANQYDTSQTRSRLQ